LAPRPEAFFFYPPLAPSARLLFHGDEPHLAMGLLAAVFTIAAVVTTWRIHQTLESSLKLRFENQDLVSELRNANIQAETLNQELEYRVKERTSELQQSSERLQAEMERRRQMEEELLQVVNWTRWALAGGIAHDFSNFLTVIQGMLNGQTGVGSRRPDSRDAERTTTPASVPLSLLATS
jgi:C4-dicarboxylate-specific signal transduction histidine kinase